MVEKSVRVPEQAEKNWLRCRSGDTAWPICQSRYLGELRRASSRNFQGIAYVSHYVTRESERLSLPWRSLMPNRALHNKLMASNYCFQGLQNMVALEWGTAAPERISTSPKQVTVHVNVDTQPRGRCPPALLIW